VRKKRIKEDFIRDVIERITRVLAGTQALRGEEDSSVGDQSCFVKRKMTHPEKNQKRHPNSCVREKGR